MVNKSQKHGVNSGNTLRTCNRRYRNAYKGQSCLIRHSSNIDSDSVTETILDELLIDSDGVEYSLNKKRRWLVPQMLRNDILYNKRDKKDIKIELVESHMIKRNSNCVGYYASKGPVKRVTPRRKTYFDVKSVKNTKCDNTKQTKKRKTIGGNIDQYVPIPVTPPSLRIDVFYPGPSSIIHTEKFSKTWDPNSANTTPLKHRSKRRQKQLADDSEDSEKIKTLRNGQSKIRSRKRSDVSEDFQSDYEYDDEDIEKCSPYYNELYTPKERRSASFGDFLPRAENKSDINKMAYHLNVRTNNRDNTTTMLPVYVVLKNTDIQPERLTEVYGNLYTECLCFPRKFVIDITDRIEIHPAVPREMLQGDSTKCDIAASLVFEYDMDIELDHPEDNVFKVYLNMKSNLDFIQIETISDFEQTTVEEVLQRTTFFVETIPPENFYTIKKMKTTNKKTVRFKNLDSNLRPNTEVYHPADVQLLTDVPSENADEKTQTVSELGFELVLPESCSICYESIGNGEHCATALQVCGHWFCDQCWLDHLQSKLDMGHTKMTCPQYKCGMEVDVGTMMSFLNVQYVEQLLRRRRDTEINKQTKTKWCPNPLCGRVLKVNNVSQKSLNVKCLCGKVVCFDCLKPPHWPASCEFTEHYLSKLADCGVKDVSAADFVKSQLTIFAKQCPKCSTYIEKFTGCNEMICIICDTSFCWACLGLLQDHTVSCPAVDDDKGRGVSKFILRDYVHDKVVNSTNHSKRFKLAVQQRASRNPWKSQVLKSNMWIISAQLKKFKHKKENEQCLELLEQGVPSPGGDDKYKRLMPTSVSEMLDLYIELSYITEYTSVYIMENEEERSGLLPLLNRLIELQTSMFESFNRGSKESYETLVLSLLELKSNTEILIGELVQNITNIYSKISEPLTSQCEEEISGDDFVVL